MIALQSLVSELAITVSDGAVWFAIGQALLFAAVCLIFGIGVARIVGLVAPGAPAGETLGVGLASGLMVLAAWWAAIWSGGRSAFTPVAIGFAVAIVLAVARRARLPATDAGSPGSDGHLADTGESSGWSRHRPLILSALAGGVFIVAIALLYGSTMAPSPRDGVQPVENRDVAFYAVLGRDLSTTGTETSIGPSGYSEIPGAPVQTWYHWGELWLASAAITILGVAPLAARFFIVLPIVLLAAAALTGTIVRRMAGTDSPRAFLFGFVACLFLAPVPLIAGPFFGTWAVGMTFGVTVYGLGAVAGLFGVYSVATLSRRTATWALAIFVGSAVAFILPAHLAIAVLAVIGVGIVATLQLIRAARARRLPVVAPVWRRTILAAGIALVATVAWGVATGHGWGTAAPSVAPPLNAPPSTIVSPFNASWRASVAITVLGAGVFLAIPIAGFLRRRDAPLYADLYVAAVGLLVAGAIGWGARLSDFTTFYLYFAGIDIFAMALAAAAVWTVLERLRRKQHRWLAVGLVLICLLQLESGLARGIVRLQGFGSSDEGSISVAMLEAIDQLPPDAKLAYSCGSFDEVAFGTPQLLSIDVHTGRRVVPMCFEAELPNTLNGAEASDLVPSQFFRGAPQAVLYPDAGARPASSAVAAFLRQHGIDYIYAAPNHPNSLVDDAIPIVSDEDHEVLSVR
jgi:hypothetical protein